MITEYIDKKSIIKIVVTEEKPVHDFIWYDERPPVKKWYSFLFGSKPRPAGYYGFDHDGDEYLADESYIEYYYKVYSRNERVNNNVVERAFIEIHLKGNKKNVIKFENNEEMMNWVNSFISENGKKYIKIIKHK